MAKSRHPRTPKSGGNGFVKKMEAAREIRARREQTLTQMMLDAMCIGANETYHRREDSIRDLCANTMTAFHEIAELTVEEAKDDPEFERAKAVLDERLKKIMGRHFQPWEVRYRRDGPEGTEK